MELENVYSRKTDDYYEHVRKDIISFIPISAKRVLDVGCGGGATGAKIKELNNVREVVGIEFVPKAAHVAKQRLDRVLVGDLETMMLDFPEGYFDCIICADVLEHCKDPWDILTKLRSCLSVDGVLIASIPNLRHIVVILKIIFNRWEYEKEGILDEGHLRFFTFSTIQNMFRKTGFVIIKVKENRSVSWKFMLLNLCSFGLLRPFSIYQYLVVAKRST